MQNMQALFTSNTPLDRIKDVSASPAQSSETPESISVYHKILTQHVQLHLLGENLSNQKIHKVSILLSIY